MILNQQIRFIGSMIVSDDTGQLMRLIQALTILIGILITTIRVIAPMLEWLQSIAEAYQFAGAILGIRISSLAWGLGLTN